MTALKDKISLFAQTNTALIFIRKKLVFLPRFMLPSNRLQMRLRVIYISYNLLYLIMMGLELTT